MQKNNTKNEVLIDESDSTAGLGVGDKVRYQPEYYGEDKWENGIIKEVRDGVTGSVWVVYNCAGEWDKYRDYTSAKTDLRDLKLGWRN